MNSIFQIIFLSILSFISIPVGKLTDIFVWQNNIIKTEAGVNCSNIASQRKKCFFNKICLRINKEIHRSLTNKKENSIRYIQFSKITSLEISLLDDTYTSFKNKILTQFIFKTIDKILAA